MLAGESDIGGRHAVLPDHQMGEPAIFPAIVQLLELRVHEQGRHPDPSSGIELGVIAHPRQIGRPLELTDLVDALRDDRGDTAKRFVHRPLARHRAIGRRQIVPADLRHRTPDAIVVAGDPHGMPAAEARPPDRDARRIDLRLRRQCRQAGPDIGHLVDRIDDLTQHAHRHRDLARFQQRRRIRRGDDPAVGLAPATIVEGQCHVASRGEAPGIDVEMLLQPAPTMAQQDGGPAGCRPHTMRREQIRGDPRPLAEQRERPLVEAFHPSPFLCRSVTVVLNRAELTPVLAL